MTNFNDYISIKDAADKIGVCSATLRRWNKSGKLKAYRNPANNYRLYKKSELQIFLKKLSKSKQ